MTTGRRIIRNSLRQGLAFALGSALQLLAIALLARHLGVDGFGRFSLLLAVASIFQILADMGVRNVLIRDLARERSQFEERVGVAKALLLVLSSAGFLVLGVGLLVTGAGSELGQAAVLATLSVVVSIHALLYGAVLRAFEEMGADAIGFVGHKVVLLALVLLLTRSSLGLKGAFLAFLGANVGLYLYYRTLVTTRHGMSPLRLDPQAAWAMLHHAAPLGLAEALRRAAWQGDRIVLALLSSPVQVGLFSTAYKLAEAMQPLLLLLTVPVFPVFSRQARDEPERLFASYARSLKFLYAGLMPIAVLAFVLGRRGLVAAFGPAYADAAPTLRLLAPALLLLAPGSLYGYLFTALGRTRLYTVAATAGLLVNLLLDLALVPHFGARGAAMATLAAETALVAAGAALLREDGRSPDAVRPLLRPLAAGAVLAALVLPLRHQPAALLLPGLLAAAAAYVAVLLALRTFTRQELGAVAAAARLREAA